MRRRAGATLGLLLLPLGGCYISPSAIGEVACGFCGIQQDAARLAAVFSGPEVMPLGEALQSTVSCRSDLAGIDRAGDLLAWSAAQGWHSLGSREPAPAQTEEALAERQYTADFAHRGSLALQLAGAGQGEPSSATVTFQGVQRRALASDATAGVAERFAETVTPAPDARYFLVTEVILADSLTSVVTESDLAVLGGRDALATLVAATPGLTLLDADPVLLRADFRPARTVCVGVDEYQPLALGSGIWRPVPQAVLPAPLAP